MDTFEKALKLVFGYEGGYTNSHKDPGGPTMFGVTQKTYSAWRTRKGLGFKLVRFITHEEAIAIYREDYWFPARCDSMSPAVAIAHFDFAVNAGPGRAAEILQRAIGVHPDGAIGPMTLRAISTRHDLDVVKLYLDEREKYYRFDSRIGIVNRAAHLKGWLNRVNALRRALGVA